MRLLHHCFAILTLLALGFGTASCTRGGNASENTLNLAFGANVKGLDPAHASDAYVTEVTAQIYESLYGYHFLKRPLELVPRLAESMPEVSKDGLTHTIKLKSGVKFQDDKCFKDGKGREVVADDFIYAWRRLADPTVQSDGFWVFDGKVKGLNEWRDKLGKGKADYATPIEGFEIPDAHTIVIKLKEPYFQLQYVLAMVYTAPVPKECVEHYGQEFLNHPIGTGPFMLDTWTRNSKIVLVKNPNFRGQTYPSDGESSDKANGYLEDAGKPLPFVDKVVYSEVIEDQPRWLNFVKGNLDFAGIPKDNFDSAIQDGKVAPDFAKKGIGLQVSVEPDVTYYAFNMDDPILGKYRYLRQAMSLAIDRKTLIDRFYNGRASAAQSMIPPGVDGYDTKYKNPFTEYNVDKAKALLKKSGFPEGKGLPEFTIDTLSSSTSRQMAEFFQQNMAAIGIKINIKTMTWPEFQKRQKEKKSQIWGIAWLGDYPDAQNFMQLFYGPNASPGPNGSNYSNKRFDELYDKSMKMPSGDARTRVYKQMRDIVVDDSPWIFGVHRLGYRVYHGWVHNLKMHVMVQDYAKYIKIDAKTRAEKKSSL